MQALCNLVRTYTRDAQGSKYKNMFVLKLERSSSGSYQALTKSSRQKKKYARFEARVGLVSSCLSARESDIQDGYASSAG